MVEIILLIPTCAPRHLVAILAIQENGPATCRNPLDAVIEIGDGPPHRDVDTITIAQITKDGMMAREDEPTSRQSILLSARHQTLGLMHHFNVLSSAKYKTT
jgi:hypothetical protein